MNDQKYFDALRQEIKPALGCTEPIAVALAVAKAKETLGCLPEQIDLWVSCNILKNAMGVGIPGTGMVGLEIASALSCIAGRSQYGLEVLSGASAQDCAEARTYAASGRIHVHTKDTEKKLYIEAHATGAGHEAICIIEDAHTSITHVQLDDQVIESRKSQSQHPGATSEYEMDVAGIYDFITRVDVERIAFLKEGLVLNDTIAQEGLNNAYGMRVGQVLQNGKTMEELSLSDYVCAYTAAAADARMAGSTLPVMSTAGSGNQGISASLPVAAAARKLGIGEEKMMRAEALSQLITIHIKTHIGKLSPLCGCAIASSIGSSSGIAYLMGGGLREIQYAIQNMISDISGLICDGAKASCALKIASSLASAIQCAKLAMAGVSATKLDGIIDEDAEESIRNLANLGSAGMDRADRVILDMMIAK
ncbi:MAG: serine dehydratase subunit alpha family protein [Clostridiales bacterium]|nr:serine dehydratase subunit alpha family protein [Clostridiales bacterium]